MTFWTDERIAELRRLAPDHTASQIAAKLGAPSRNAVIGKINWLKLALNPDRKPNAGADRCKPLIRRGEGDPAVMLDSIRSGSLNERCCYVGAVPTFRCVGCPHDRQAPAEPVGAFSSTPPVSTIGGRYQCTLAFLTKETCRFPCWDDSIPQDDRRYCGGKAIEGLPYCRTHADLCYTGQERSTLPMRRFA